jgi:hypothetical protein
VTAAHAELQPGRVVVSDDVAGIEVGFDPGELDVSMEVICGVEKQYAPSVDLTRIIFAPRIARREGSVRLMVTPRPLG